MSIKHFRPKGTNEYFTTITVTIFSEKKPNNFKLSVLRKICQMFDVSCEPTITAMDWDTRSTH